MLQHATCDWWWLNTDSSRVTTTDDLITILIMDTAVMPHKRVLRSEAPPTCRHNLTFASASSPICHMNFAICCLRSNIAQSISSLNGYLNTLLAAVVDWSAGVLLPLVTTPVTDPRWRVSAWPCCVTYNTTQLNTNQAKTHSKLLLLQRQRLRRRLRLWLRPWRLLLLLNK